MTEIRLRAIPNLGFLVDIVIDHHEAVKERLRKDGIPVPAPVIAKALVDTGAAICGATQGVIDALQLPSPRDFEQKIATPNKTVRSRLYSGSLTIKDQPRLRASYVRFAKFEMEVPFEVVLGLPVLLTWNFEYRKEKGELRLWLPG